MRRHRGLALLLLFLTLLPSAIWVFIIVAYVPAFDASPPVDETPEQFLQQPFTQGLLLAVSLTFGLMAFYIVHLYTRRHDPGPTRALWLALIVFANIFAMPFYWYFFIWPKQDKAAA
jgi:uncharacterized membrane protein